MNTLVQRELSVFHILLWVNCLLFLILYIAMGIPSATGLTNNVSDTQFNAVFGQSLWIIIGSITAFFISQLIDIAVFHFFKKKTGIKMIWLRTTGSTVISQFFDSFIVLGIAFWLTGIMNTPTFIALGITGYIIKLIIAVLLTPFIYLGHYIIDRYLREENEIAEQ